MHDSRRPVRSLLVVVVIALASSPLILLPRPVAAGTPVSGVIGVDTVWGLAGSPYWVVGDVTVAFGATLRIEAGVAVRFDGFRTLYVNGSLFVAGAAGAPVTLTSNDTSPIPGSWRAIQVNSTGDATFSFARVEYGAYGMMLSGSRGARIGNTTFANNTYGIWADSASLSVVMDSRFEDHTGPVWGIAIRLMLSYDNLIVRNVFARNDGFGVFLLNSFNNSLFHNDFVNNVNQASDDRSDNRWDDGYSSGGNHWSDYGGIDACSGPAQDVCPDPDGIGDTPRAIDTANVDRYPLMASVRENLPPEVTVQAPAGGERWTCSSTHPIRWTASDDRSPASDLRVWANYSETGGPPFPTPIFGDVPGDSSPHPWVVPAVNATSVVLNVTAVDPQGAAGWAWSASFAIDCAAPGVVATSPALGETGVPYDATIMATFSEPMNASAFAFGLSPTVLGSLTWDGSGTTVLFTPSNPLADCTSYTASIDGARDRSDPGLDLSPLPFLWSFTTYCNAAPSVAFLRPAGGEVWTGESVQSIAVAAIDGEDPVDSLRLWVNYSLDGGMAWSPVSGAQGIAPPSVPPWSVPRVNVVGVLLRAEILDTGGLRGSATSGAFDIDSTPPNVQGEPTGTGAPLNAEPKATFDEPMRPAIATTATFGLWDVTHVRWVDGTVSWLVPHQIMTFSPSAPLLPGTTYEAQINTSAADASDPGNPLPAPFIWRFVTSMPDTVPPIARAGGPYRTAVGAMIRFDGTGSSDDVGVANWTWVLEFAGQTVTLYGPSPAYTFPRAGTYDLTLTVRDEAGNLATDATTVTVEPAVGNSVERPWPWALLLALLVAVLLLAAAWRRRRRPARREREATAESHSAVPAVSEELERHAEE